MTGYFNGEEVAIIEFDKRRALIQKQTGEVLIVPVNQINIAA